MSRTPKDDAEALMSTLLPFAEEMLAQHGAFVPYGGAMLPDGSVIAIDASEGLLEPTSEQLIDQLTSSFRTEARVGTYRATCIVYDITTTPPGETEETDAIAARLDHEDGYSAVVMLPYRISAGGAVVKGTIFAVKGAGTMFPRRNPAPARN